MIISRTASGPATDERLPHHPTKGSRIMTEHLRPQPGIMALPARLRNALQMAGQRRGRRRVWFAVVMWLLFGGVVWGGMVASAVASLHRSAAVANQGGSAARGAGAAGMDPGRSTGLAVSFGLIAVGTLLYTHFAGGISWASLGMRRRDGRRRIFGGAAGTAVLYAAAMVLGDRVFQALATSQRGGPRGYPGMGTPGARLLAGDITSVTFGGGIWEELTLLAIPVALFTALVPLEKMGRTGRYVSWSALVVALLAARWALHLYYGTPASLYVLVWAPAAAALFLVSGTIWPLILAHSLYDAAAFTTARIPATNTVVTWLFWAAGAAAVIVLAGTGRSWRNRSLASGGGI